MAPKPNPETQTETGSTGVPPSPEAPVKTAPKPAKGEIGVSGTTNYVGRIFAEQNDALIDGDAYGRPGTRTWGEWEKIIRTDPDCSSALDLTVSALRDAEVAVAYDEPGEGEEPGNPAIAAFVRDNLTQWMDPTWPVLMEQMPRGFLTFGYSLHEKVFSVRNDKRVPGGKAYFIEKLAQRLPNSVHPNGWHEKEGELSFIRQQGQKNGQFVTVDLPADKTVLCSWNRDGNNYQGFSAFRPVWYIAKVREALVKIIALGHQRESLGVPVAKMEREVTLTVQQRRKLQRLLENLVYHENAAVVLPAGVEIEWVYSPAANKGHVIDTWKQLGLVIKEVLQAQQMALGTGDTGSRAVGGVHDANKNTFVNGVKTVIEAAFNGIGTRPYAGVIKQLVDMNFGAQERYPKLALVLKQTDLDPTAFINALGTAIDKKIVTPTAKDENIVREKLGLKPITPEEREAEQAKRQEKAMEIAKGQGGFPPKKDDGEDDEVKAKGPEDEEDDAEDEDREEEEAKPKQFAIGNEFVAWRELHEHEKHVSFAEIDQFLDDAKTDFESGALPILVEMLVAVRPAIREAMKDGDPSEVSGIQLDTERLSKFIEKFLERARTEGNAHVAYEQGSQPKSQAPVPATQVQQLAIGDEETVENLIAAMRDQLLRRMTSRMIAEIERQAIDAVRTGGDPDEVVSRIVQRTLETKGLRQDAGSVTAKAFNIGREEFAQEYGDQVAAVRLSAVMDRNTCSYCRSVDGNEFTFGSPEHAAHVPPLRECEGQDNCRCILIYEFIQ